jgi:hypothetical protein
MIYFHSTAPPVQVKLGFSPASGENEGKMRENEGKIICAFLYFPI